MEDSHWTAPGVPDPIDADDVSLALTGVHTSPPWVATMLCYTILLCGVAFPTAQPAYPDLPRLYHNLVCRLLLEKKK